MTSFDVIIGQDAAVHELQHAAADANGKLLSDESSAMTHAWLITGPPGSGRSTLALAFACALVCSQGGCGTCIDCRNVVSGVHADVEHVIPEGVHYSIANTVALIERASMMPTRAPWHIILIEDVDRLNVDAASVLLKSLEEPPPQTVWLLCAPTAEDVFDTIRSRCRQVHLSTPSLGAIAEQLVSRFGIDPAMAEFATRVSQGHIGRARAIATDEQVRIRRKEILDIPSRLKTVSACFSYASQIVATVAADTDSIVGVLDTQDEENIKVMFGEGASGKGLRGIERAKKSAIKDLEKRHKDRRRRVVADQYSRVLLDLTGLYRDILVIQSQAAVPLINEELRPTLEHLADLDTETQTLQRIDAINESRDHLLANVTPLSVFESLLVTLRDPALESVKV